MKQQYTTKGFSDSMNMEGYCSTFEGAKNTLKLLAEFKHYYKAYIMNTYTGEVYCGFDRTNDENTERITFWTIKR